MPKLFVLPCSIIQLKGALGKNNLLKEAKDKAEIPVKYNGAGEIAVCIGNKKDSKM